MTTEKNKRICEKLIDDEIIDPKVGEKAIHIHVFKESNVFQVKDMVDNSISIEDIMFEFFNDKNTEFDSHTYCLWHDAHGDKYYEY